MFIEIHSLEMTALLGLAILLGVAGAMAAPRQVVGDTRQSQAAGHGSATMEMLANSSRTVSFVS